MLALSAISITWSWIVATVTLSQKLAAPRTANGIVYHTYSAYARGLDGLWGMYQWLDRAPRGQNETRAEGRPLNFYRRHDEYDVD